MYRTDTLSKRLGVEQSFRKLIGTLTPSEVHHKVDTPKRIEARAVVAAL